MAKGSGDKGMQWAENRLHKRVSSTKHLQELESENRALRRELQTVLCFAPHLLDPRKRYVLPKAKTGTSRQAGQLLVQRAKRPATSIGVRAHPDNATPFEHASKVPHGNASREERPSTSTGFREVEESPPPPSNNSRSRTRRRSPRRSAPIRVPGHEIGSASNQELDGVALQPESYIGSPAAPQEQRPQKNSAIEPLRPSTSLGIRAEHGGNDGGRPRDGRTRRPNTSLGPRESVSPERSDSRQFPSERLLHPQPTTRIKDLKQDPDPPASRWKSKTFKPEEWDRFLARQNEHTHATTRLSLSTEQLSRMQTAPLLPISSMVFRIDGGTYVESGARQPRKSLSVSSLPADLSSLHDALSPNRKSLARQRSLESASWREFLGRQSELLNRKGARCETPGPPGAHSASARASDQQSEARAGSGHVRKRGGKFEEFFKRNMEYRTAKEEYLDGLRDFYCPPRAESPPVQDPAFRVRHDPNMADEHFQEAVEEAMGKWREDCPLGPGESPLFKKKHVSQEEADSFWEKNRAFPHVSNRERPVQTEPPEAGFKLSGNPYEGGKADMLLHKLGPKSGITQLNATLP